MCIYTRKVRYIMKKLLSMISLLLCLCMLSPALAVTAVEADLGATVKAVIGDSGVSPSAYSYNGYVTHTMGEASLLSIHANKTVGGTSCTSMQGMNVGTTYIYTAKRNSSDTYVSIARTTISSGSVSYMNYYSSTSATSTSGCDTCGHANDLQVVTANDVNYMLVATSIKGNSLSRMKISGTNLYFTGYFDTVNTSGTSMTVSSVRQYKHSGGYFYLLLKNGETFYYCKIADTATGGTASNPTKVTCYKIFTIDKRNAIFAKSNSSAGTYANMETWVNQGFYYNSLEQTIYVPMFKPASPITTNVILTYNVSKVLTDALMDFSTNKTTLVHPTKTNFYLTASATSSSCNDLEIESVGFRTGQGTTGDLKMYINANASPVASFEGVYSMSYKSGTGDFTPMVDDSAVVYTVKYNANGGTDSGTNSSSGNYKMSSTIHIKGVSTNLRPNYFTYSGYTFAGWYLTRKSDGKWLYFTESGNPTWYTKGSQPATAVLALYEDKRSVSALTSVDGDTVTCYAQWTPNSTGTKSYYIQYDANGGTGTMAQQKIVYGTSTAITSNAFTREGYTFVGWTAFRRSDNTWCYKNTSTLADKWLAPGTDTTGYFLKTYTDGCSISASSSTDRDIVTFYAAWAKVDNGKYPTEHTVGEAFTLGGTLNTDTGLYNVSVSVLNSAGTAVATHTSSPYTTSYDLSAANADINISTLPIGSYTYTVQMQTINGSSPKTHTVLSAPFTVVSAAKLELTDAAAASGSYSLNEYFSGFAVGTTGTALKTLFKYEVTITDNSGTAVADGNSVGTGYTVSCGDESCIAVLQGDINGDADISSLDYLALTTSIKKALSFTGAYFIAADMNGNNTTDSADCILIKLALAR